MARKKKEETFKDNLIETTNDILETKDSTSEYTSSDIKKNKGMAMLAYLFVPIPLLFEKRSKFVKYHIKQKTTSYDIAFLIY